MAHDTCLAESIDAFRNVRTPIECPKLPLPPLPSSSEDENKDENEDGGTVKVQQGSDGGMSTGALIGVVTVVVVVVVVLVVGIVGRIWWKRRAREADDDEYSQESRDELAPPDHGITTPAKNCGSHPH